MATAVAASLVGAYAELRQLQFLLQSVLEALLSQHPATAAAVICTSAFVSALARVSTQLWLSMLWQMLVRSSVTMRMPSLETHHALSSFMLVALVLMMRSSSLE